MATGEQFKKALIEHIIEEWNINDLEIYEEVWLGERFVGKKRFVDIVLKYNEKTFAIEAKIQYTQGTADQKLYYTLEDCRNSPIPTVIAFTGDKINIDIKSKLILSGYGIEVKTAYNPETKTVKIVNSDTLRQRAFIELGIDWLKEQKSKKVKF